MSSLCDAGCVTVGGRRTAALRRAALAARRACAALRRASARRRRSSTSARAKTEDNVGCESMNNSFNDV
jgi:hypothetical protein